MQNKKRNGHISISCFAILFSLCQHAAICQDTTLQSIAPFPFGASINTTLLQTNANYRSVVAREYNSVTPENAMKIAAIHPAMNTYNWVNADTLVNFAEQYHKRIHGHCLVWHQSLPGWVTSFTGDSTAWENLLKTHIQTVVGHYKGRLASWDVVNEAFNDDGTLRSSIWLQHLGSNYIARSFQYAHEADPAALLFYNDYGQEYSTAKLNAIANLLNTLKQNGIPVHGVGMQMHINKNSNNNSIANAINVMAQTGLKVHISELDISMNPENNLSLTYTPAIAQLQADKYKFVTRIYRTVPAAQRYGITTWDVSDADTWITGTYSRPDWPLPFDSAYRKKQAYTAIIEGLTSNWKYEAATAQSNAGIYTDLGNNGTAITTNFSGAAMTNDDDNSSVQQIGFSFLYNGSTYNEFVLNTNGYIKLGANAPSSAAIFYPGFSANTNGVITAPDIDVLYPYNHDLTGTATTEYRVYTSGQPGTRICTIQYKNISDKLAPTQYANMQMQVKLYESGGTIEFVYGAWTSSINTATLTTGAVGIKGLNAANSVNLAKGSGSSWSATLSTANTIYYVNGDYATAGPQFNSRNNVLPDAGRTLRFTPLADIVLPITLSSFSAINNKTSIALRWLSMNATNIKEYEIQRSINGVDFNSIGSMMAKTGSNNSQLDYNFSDADIAQLPRTIYYRLKQNDIDGKSSYSGVLMIQLDAPAKLLTIKTPNPFKGPLNIQIASGSSGMVSVTVTNANGIMMVRKTVSVQPGTNLVTIKETLPVGLYFLQCRKDDEVINLKLVKE